MTTLPASRCVINGRTFSRPWNPSDSDPISCYPRASSRLVTVAYAAVCLAASALIGWLIAQGA